LYSKKDILRKSCLERRNSLGGREVRERSSNIFNKLKNTGEFKRSRYIMCYMNFGSEVDTSEFIKECLELGKRIAIPLIEDLDGRGKEITPCEISDMESNLEKGAYGILEPKKETARRIEPQLIDLVVVPGVAFDMKKNRIGYGAGYYDRFLKKVGKDCVKIAVAFELQIVDKIPFEVHDFPMDMIITEKRIIL
jgi:5-formyltetrahydrofolate cyclo-ligase